MLRTGVKEGFEESYYYTPSATLIPVGQLYNLLYII